MNLSPVGKVWSDGREARLRTANPATRVQIPFRPPYSLTRCTEHWFIVQGSGIVTIDGVESPVKAGDTVEFAIGVLHRLANTGNEEIIFIEVQTGTSFAEDDIERIEDDFGRAGK